MQRREFIIGCSAGVALTAMNGVQSFAFAPENNSNAPKEIVIFLFLRGGFDALHFLAPVSDKNYQDARPKGLRIEENEGLALKNTLGGLDFKLHPKAAPLKEIYDSGKLAFIHACGLTNGTRSHFDAMDLIERGLVEKQGGAEGWMARYLQQTNLGDAMIPAVASGWEMPLSLVGNNLSASIGNVAEFDLKGDKRFAGILKHLYQGEGLLNKTAQQTLETIQYIQQQIPRKANNKPADYHAEHGADYPMEWQIKGFSESLMNLARLIKMDLGVHLATVDFGGWDMHDNQNYLFPQKLDALSRALAAFYNDMSTYHPRLTIVAMSEFGRRLKANKSMGTDHGYGGVAMVMGGKVKGGKMYGQWPGLANEELDNRVDLKVTTDYRYILAELLEKRLASTSLATILPGLEKYEALNFL